MLTDNAIFIASHTNEFEVSKAALQNGRDELGQSRRNHGLRWFTGKHDSYLRKMDHHLRVCQATILILQLEQPFQHVFQHTQGLNLLKLSRSRLQFNFLSS